MFRSACSALLALLCVSSINALAQSPGAGAVTVTLTPPSNPTASGVSLTSTVQAVPVASTTLLPHPSGTVTLFDGTTDLNPGGAAITAGPGSTASTFAQFLGTPDPALTANGSQPGGVVGDFNEDGTPDLLLYGENNASTNMLQVQVFVSAPGGKFVTLPLQNLSFPGGFPIPVPAVLDVNGDGHVDVLFGNMVAYGKGDGTFGTPATLPILASGFSQTYAVDVTGDGKLDIVAVNTPPNPATATGSIQFTFTVFRNDGSGTFTSLGSFPLAAPLPQGSYAIFNIFGLSFADLNGDGKLDVLSQSNGVPFGNAENVVNFNVLLNYGDGTFLAPMLVDTSSISSFDFAPGFADLNGDGKLDLVLACSGSPDRIASALGNGDGTFGAFQQLPLGRYISNDIGLPQLQLGDYNADGKIDAVLGTGQLALGNGDGTFSVSAPLFPLASVMQPISYPLFQAAFLPNSLPSFVFLNLTSGANAVFTPVATSSVTTNLTLSAGMHSLTAHYSGDANYAATVSPAASITVAPTATTTTLTSSANPSYTDGNVTFTATIAGLAPGATGSVAFSNGSTALGTVPVSSGNASVTTSFASAGNPIITAAYSGDANNGTSSGMVNQAVEAPVGVGAGGSSSTSLTVTSGQSVTATVSVMPAAGFSGSVALSCTGLPTNASCSFSPASVTVSGSTAATTMLTVSTGSVAAAAASTSDRSGFAPAAVLACGLPLLGLLSVLPLRRGRRALMVLAFAALLSGIAVTGCGGNSTPAQSSQTNTPAGSYTFSVVATAGASQSTAKYMLTVQ